MVRSRGAPMASERRPRARLLLLGRSLRSSLVRSPARRLARDLSGPAGSHPNERAPSSWAACKQSGLRAQKRRIRPRLRQRLPAEAEAVGGAPEPERPRVLQPPFRPDTPASYRFGTLPVSTLPSPHSVLFQASCSSCSSSCRCRCCYNCCGNPGVRRLLPPWKPGLARISYLRRCRVVQPASQPRGRGWGGAHVSECVGKLPAYSFTATTRPGFVDSTMYIH